MDSNYKKAVLQENLYCEENLPLQWLHYGCLECLEELDIDCIGKYIFIEKMAFLSMSNICFHDHAFTNGQNSWNNYFLGQFPGNSFEYSNILIPMK